MTPAQLEARRKGGLVLRERRGLEYYADLGRRYGHLGGRPRAITIKEVELAQSRENITMTEEGNPSTNSLSELRRLWARRLGQ